MCPSYPQYVVIPQSITDKDIVKCAEYRADMRFPALSYYYKKNGASIWRSTQPTSGSTNPHDQRMIKAIVATLPADIQPSIKFKDPKRTEARLHIFDVRVRGSASAKYEFSYPSAWMWLYEVDAVQKTKESYVKLLQLNNNPSCLFPQL